MTTAHSPLRVLKAQAYRIAQLLKAASRGEKIAAVNDPIGADKMAEALKKERPSSSASRWTTKS